VLAVVAINKRTGKVERAPELIVRGLAARISAKTPLLW